MRASVSLRLKMAHRAVDFCLSHPDHEPSRNQVSARLAALLARADALARQQRTGTVTLAAAVAQKAETLKSLRLSLSAVVGIARAARPTTPGIAISRVMPHKRTDEHSFVTVVRVTTAGATAALSQLAQFGLSDRLLDRLTRELDAYDTALARQRDATAAQVGATADLEVVASAIITVVKNLDAINRSRFHGNPDLKAEWKSSRKVGWRVRPPKSRRDPPS